MEVVASLSQDRTAAAQCGLFTHKSVPVIFEPPCIYKYYTGITYKLRESPCRLFIYIKDMSGSNVDQSEGGCLNI